MDPLRDMNLFVEVARTLSFKRAASNLNISKSSASRRVKELEKSMGMQLFNRTTRRTELTEAGKTYYTRCQYIVAEAQAASNELQEQSESPKGQLRVSMSVDFGTITLAPLLLKFTHLYPQVQLKLNLTSRRVDMLAEPIDIAIRMGALNDSSLYARRISTGLLNLYATKEYLQSAGSPLHPLDLANHNCILVGSDTPEMTWTLNKGKEKIAAKVTGKIQVNTMGIALRFAVLGGGIALLGSQIAQADYDTGNLQRVLPKWAASPVPIYAVTASRLKTAAARLFIEFLASELGDSIQ